MIIFLDFEASSLDDSSYPIEVGCVTEDGGGEAHLIRPAPGWEDWSEASERIHGLSRARLEREGSPVEVAAIASGVGVTPWMESQIRAWLVVEMRAEVPYPASSGRHVRCGFRQSIPSSM